MYKRKTALLLSVVMILQSGISVKAAVIDVSEESYVVMADDLEMIQEVLGTKEDIAEEALEEEHEALMQEAGIIVSDLNVSEVHKLEQADIIVEEDISFDASSYDDTEQVLEMTTEESESEGGMESEYEMETEENIEPEEDTEEESEKETERNKELNPDLDNKISAEPIAEWNISAVHAEDYVKDTAADKIKIAVLDSGVAFRPDITVEERVTEIERLETGFIVFEDSTGHGTAVASLINGVAGEEGIMGMNEDAEIYSVQVLNNENKGKLSEIVKGIYWAIDHDMDIINMSFGTGSDSEILHKAVRDAKDAGILLVASAGNQSGEAVQYPAAYEEVIAVGSSNMQGNIAENSARGEKVDIYAPGDNILVDDPLFGTTDVSGTSMACAQVTAAASVILERDKSKGPDFVRGLLEDTANNLIDVDCDNGLLDLEEAMNQYDAYIVGEKPAVGSVEQKTLGVFEEEEVKALWGGKDHQKTIPEGVGGYKLMYASSVIPDERELVSCDANGYCVARENPLWKNRRFHGSKNYKKTLKFLVDLAYAYYNNSNVQAVYDSAASELYTVETYSEGSFKYTTVQAIEIFLDRSYFSYLGVDESTNKNKAYKIMGVVAHVVGDTYAHRTMVTTDMISKFSKKDFKTENDFGIFGDYVAMGKVDFRNVKNYTTKLSSDESTSKYEDNTAFVSSRYTNAKNSVNKLLTPGEKYDFRTTKWNNAALNHLDTLFPY